MANIKKPRNYKRLRKIIADSFNPAYFDIISIDFIRKAVIVDPETLKEEIYYYFNSVVRDKDEKKIKVYIEYFYKNGSSYCLNENNTVLSLEDVKAIKEINVQALEVLYGNK